MKKINTVIFAGGWGSRLGSITEIKPKPMINIGDMPILWHIMKFYSQQGFKDFVILSGVKQEEIKKFFVNYEIIRNDINFNTLNGKLELINKIKEDWNVTVLNTGINSLKGNRLFQLKKIIKKNNFDTFFLTYGDGLSDINLSELLKYHRSHKKILTISGVRPIGRFGEIIENNGLLKSFEEKPSKTKTFVNGGFMVVNKEIFDYLDESIDLDFETTIFNKLITKNEIMVYKHQGHWFCMDNERDVLFLNNLWEEERAFWKNW